MKYYEGCMCAEKSENRDVSSKNLSAPQTRAMLPAISCFTVVRCGITVELIIHVVWYFKALEEKSLESLGYPQWSSIYRWIFHYKPSIFGVPKNDFGNLGFRRPPCFAMSAAGTCPLALDPRTHVRKRKGLKRAKRVPKARWRSQMLQPSSKDKE